MSETQASSHTNPVTSADRFESLDILRGIAVLGILLVNVQAFTMAYAAYSYPPAHMDVSGANGLTWLLTHIFFELKFITIFSALFGAGVILMVGPDKDASRKLHYSRMRWMLVFGLIHMFAFWFGDILTSYALAGFIIVAFRHLSPTKLIVWGLVWVLLSGLLMFALFGSMALAPAEMRDPVNFGLALSPEDLSELVDQYTSGYLSSRMPNAFAGIMNLVAIVMFGGRLIGIMFFGMALFKMGFLTAQWSVRAYLAGVVIGLGIGVPVIAIPAQAALDAGFPVETMWVHTMANYFGSLFVAFGYASLVMIIAKTPWLALIRMPFAAAGRMAFTNYLMQTLIMVFLTVGGIGLGLFGQLERVEQFQIVLAIWVFQLILSPLWLSVFRFGPMEWLWRSLSYGSFQPMSKPKPTPSST